MVGGVVLVTGHGWLAVDCRAVFEHVAGGVVGVVEGNPVAVGGAGQAAQGVVGVVDGDDALTRPARQGDAGAFAAGDLGRACRDYGAMVGFAAPEAHTVIIGAEAVFAQRKGEGDVAAGVCCAGVAAVGGIREGLDAQTGVNLQ